MAIVITIYHCQKTRNLVEKLKRSVQNIEIEDNSRMDFQTKQNLLMLSRHLEANPIVFTLCGFYAIDSSLLGSVSVDTSYDA